MHSSAGQTWYRATFARSMRNYTGRTRYGVTVCWIWESISSNLPFLGAHVQYRSHGWYCRGLPASQDTAMFCMLFCLKQTQNRMGLPPSASGPLGKLQEYDKVWSSLRDGFWSALNVTEGKIITYQKKYKWNSKQDSQARTYVKSSCLTIDQPNNCDKRLPPKI